jgi:hypothetical protein
VHDLGRGRHPEVRAGSREHPHRVTAAKQLRDQRRAQIAGAAGDEDQASVSRAQSTASKMAKLNRCPFGIR